MDEFIIGIFVFTLFLLVWASLGHVIWLALLAVLRAVLGSKCAQCGRKHLGPRCARCAAQPAALDKPSVHSDLAAAQRLIAFAKFHNWLDSEQQAALEKLVLRLSQRVAGNSNLDDTRTAETAAAIEQARDALTNLPPNTPPPLVKPQSQVTPQPLHTPPAETDRRPLPPVGMQPRSQKSSSSDAAFAIQPASTPASPREEPVVHPLEIPDQDDSRVATPRAPIQQRVTANLLQSFMEQSNIRWVELISAALIVICSVGLVISLWSTLSRTSRFFPSLVFLLATLAVHGAGQYTLRQWKLRTTSRGILHIGLMLIPLAMLVGILLSRRGDELPQLDIATLAVIGVGTTIYGALAVSACKSLFSRYWPIVAALSMIASLTLLPIYYFAERAWLNTASATWILLPLVATNLLVAAQLSRMRVRLLRARLRPKIEHARHRQFAGMVTQSLFATLVAIAFWLIQSKHQPAISDWWFAATGLIAGGWASWGWASSQLPTRRPAEHGLQKTESSWLVIAAWFVASLASLCLIAFVWQIASVRSVLMTLLLGVGVYWMLQGWLCNVRLGMLTGALATVVACGLLLDGAFMQTMHLQAVDWLSFVRIATLSVAGILTAVGAAFGATLLRREPDTRPSVPLQLGRADLPMASLTALLEQVQLAAGLAVASAALLTLAASLVPFGATPYGGNWAALMLMAYGGLAMSAGIWISSRPTSGRLQLTELVLDSQVPPVNPMPLPEPLSSATRQVQGSTGKKNLADFVKQSLLPIGQIVLLLGTVRLCQTSPMLDAWLADLRPAYAWALGIGILALTWAVLGVFLRTNERREEYYSNSIDMLCGGAALLSLCSAAAFWTRDDHFLLASQFGWLLPLTWLGIYWCWRHPHLREGALIATCLWLITAVYQFGSSHGWWAQLGLAGSCSSLVLLLAATVAGFEWIIATSSRLQPSRAHAAAENPRLTWLSSGDHTASTSLIAMGWIALCLGMLGPAILHVAHSLGGIPTELPSSFVAQSLGATGFGLMLTATAVLTAASLWLGRLNTQSLLIDMTSLMSISLAFGVAATIQPPYSLMAAMCLLAGLLTASDALQFAGGEWQSRSLAAWQRLLSPYDNTPSGDNWLILGRMLSLGMLGLGTIAFIVAAINESLPAALAPQLSSWAANVGLLLKCLGPALLVALVRWGLGVWNAERPRLISTAVGMTAVVTACTASLAMTSLPRMPTWAIVFLQSFGLTAAVLAWATLGFTGLRNFLGLRAMLRGKLPTQQLVAKSMKGARWQRTEQAAWSILGYAMAVAGLLCTAAAMVVIAFPARELPGIDRLGGVAVLLSGAVTLALFWFLSIRRGSSKFGLLAISLGLAAPLAAASYASWLVEDPSRRQVGAGGFEALHGLLTLWLLALAIGLSVRIFAWRQGQPTKRVGEIAWILLAGLVAILATLSTTQDPNYVWPLLELSGLALVGVLSGVFSGQAWRGHLAAVAAAMGLSVWLIHPGLGGSAGMLQEIWLVLWGPVWVALVALATQFAIGYRTPTGDSVLAEAVRIESRSSAWTTVDFSTSLLVPLTSGLFSFLWLVGQRSAGVAPPSLLTWWILGLGWAGLCLAIARLWNPQPSKRGLAVYLNLIGLALVLAISLCSLGELPRKQTWLVWLASGLGAMAVMAALLRELMRESTLIGKQLKLKRVTSPEKYKQALSWMPTVHTLASMLALLPCILLVLAFEERTLRIAATTLPFIGALSILPIAGHSSKSIFRYCGLTLISASILLLWWADLPSAWALTTPSDSWIFVQRAFVGFIVLGVGYPLLAHALFKKADWVQPLMNMGWATFFIGITIGLAMLAGELHGLWRQAAAGADPLTKILTLGAWMGVVARLLQFAVRPHASDVRASDGIRKAAVFASEVGLALLCTACYFHFPEWFSGILVDWWPIVVFAIAMLSTGLGQYLHRLNQTIVADPIQQSSLLLPIIPLAGVWFFQPPSAQLVWHDWGRYALLLLTAAGLYGLHGWARQSVRLRALSGMLALFAFWSLLQSQPDLGFFQHPQFWLLPPALAALLFVELNRQRLDDAVVVGTRYVAILIAYLSSTSEVFLKAFEGQLWQPMLLLVLALAGVAAGIVMRVRAFLYCGAAFTMVALLGMVWHAQQAIGQVWPWWAFGIATGVGLIILLGYFEKNRPRVVAYLEQLKQWDQ